MLKHALRGRPWSCTVVNRIFGGFGIGQTKQGHRRRFVIDTSRQTISQYNPEPTETSSDEI